jgi:hypothetical protein
MSFVLASASAASEAQIAVPMIEGPTNPSVQDRIRLINGAQRGHDVSFFFWILDLHMESAPNRDLGFVRFFDAVCDYTTKLLTLQKCSAPSLPYEARNTPFASISITEKKERFDALRLNNVWAWPYIARYIAGFYDIEVTEEGFRVRRTPLPEPFALPDPYSEPTHYNATDKQLAAFLNALLGENPFSLVERDGNGTVILVRNRAVEHLKAVYQDMVDSMTVVLDAETGSCELEVEAKKYLEPYPKVPKEPKEPKAGKQPKAPKAPQISLFHSMMSMFCLAGGWAPATCKGAQHFSCEELSEIPSLYSCAHANDGRKCQMGWVDGTQTIERDSWVIAGTAKRPTYVWPYRVFHRLLDEFRGVFEGSEDIPEEDKVNMRDHWATMGSHGTGPQPDQDLFVPKADVDAHFASKVKGEKFTYLGVNFPVLEAVPAPLVRSTVANVATRKRKLEDVSEEDMAQIQMLLDSNEGPLQIGTELQEQEDELRSVVGRPPTPRARYQEFADEDVMVPYVEEDEEYMYDGMPQFMPQAMAPMAPPPPMSPLREKISEVAVPGAPQKDYAKRPRRF